MFNPSVSTVNLPLTRGVNLSPTERGQFVRLFQSSKDLVFLAKKRMPKLGVIWGEKSFMKLRFFRAFSKKFFSSNCLIINSLQRFWWT